jgi:hypothetical protein
MFNERAYTAATFLDVPEARDTTCATELIYKPQAAGIPDSS